MKLILLFVTLFAIFESYSTASAELVTEFNFKLLDKLEEFKSKINKNIKLSLKT